jgi:hypothetical protein
MGRPLPTTDRKVVGPSARDERPYEVNGLCEQFAVALVLAEGPIVESLAAVAHGFFGCDVGCGHEPIQRHADVEDHIGHWDLSIRTLSEPPGMHWPLRGFIETLRSLVPSLLLAIVSINCLR